jgi:hypothetical protein
MRRIANQVRVRTAGALASALILSSAGLNAQDRPTVVSPAQPGWIGIQYVAVHRATPVAGGSPRPVEITVTRVLENGGAWMAGIRAGDVLERVFDQPASESALRVLTETLRAGDSVQVVVRRDDHSFEATVEATPRPVRGAVAEVTWQLDSAASAVFRALDSIRVPSWSAIDTRVRVSFDEELAVELPPQRAPRRRDGLTVVIRGPSEGRSTWTYSVDAGAQAQSFDAYVLDSPDLKQLASGLDAVRGELAELTSRQGERMAELGLVRLPERTPDDPELARLRTTVQRLESRSQRLERQLAFASMRRVRPIADSVVHVRIGETRPITPYAFLSRDFFAGALIAPVRKDLGRYFGVETGALVVDVADGSPADDAGFRPGDVVVGIGDQEPADLRSLREAMAQARPPVEVTVVRNRSRVRLSIH